MSSALTHERRNLLRPKLGCRLSSPCYVKQGESDLWLRDSLCLAGDFGAFFDFPEWTATCREHIFSAENCQSYAGEFADDLRVCKNDVWRGA